MIGNLPSQNFLAQTKPTYRIQKSTAKAPRLAQPLDVLGAEPHRQINYRTRLAEALLSDRASQVRAESVLPPETHPGTDLPFIDTYA